jgi:rod shape-determining protein MreD
MRQLMIAGLLALTIALQSALRVIWGPFAYLDLSLVVVVYFALKREPFQALAVGFAAGLATDALSGGLLGAGGFSKTLTAYLIWSVSTRIMLDTPLLRLPVLACAVVIDDLVFVALHQLLGQSPPMPFARTLLYRAIATPITGALLLYAYDGYFSESARARRRFAVRRRVARRSTGVLRRR